MTNIEREVARTILQKTVEIVIGDETFAIAPPSTATLILASEKIADLPPIRLDAENIVFESLNVARDCRVIGEVIAILILGAKGLQATKKRFFGVVNTAIDLKAELSKKLLEDLSPRELNELLVKLLHSLQVSDFFGLTTSLLEINLLRQTRVVATKTATTASGL